MKIKRDDSNLKNRRNHFFDQTHFNEIYDINELEAQFLFC